MVIRRHEDRQKATLLVLNIFSEKIFSCGFGIYRGRLPLGTDVWRLGAAPLPARSEEHTSELQSLMRISYAVFCLKKKKNKNKQYIKQKNTHNNTRPTEKSTQTKM